MRREEWRGKRPLVFIFVKALSKLSAGLWLEATIVISLFTIFSLRDVFKIFISRFSGCLWVFLNGCG